jgi:hypothetical protein
MQKALRVFFLLCAFSACIRSLTKITDEAEVPAAPSVVSLSPVSGFRPKEGFTPTRVRIRGTLIEGATVTFTGSSEALASACVDADGALDASDGFTTLCVNVPVSATTGPVRISLPNGGDVLTAPSPFEVLGTPVITDFAPADGFGRLVKNPTAIATVATCDYTSTLGDNPPCLRVLEVAGDNFDASTPGNNHVRIGAIPAEIASVLGVSRQRLFLLLPDAVDNDPITLETPAGSVSSLVTLDVPPAPTLIGVSPLTTFYNQLVVLRGSGFDRTTFGNNVVVIEITRGDTVLERRATPFAITASTISFLMPEFGTDEILPGERVTATLRITSPSGEDALVEALTIIGPPALDTLTVDNSRLDELVSIPPKALLNTAELVHRGAQQPIGSGPAGELYLVRPYAGDACEDTQPPVREKLGSKLVLCGYNFDQNDNMRVTFGEAALTPSTSSSPLCAGGTTALEFLIPTTSQSARLRLTTLSGVIDEVLDETAYHPAPTLSRAYPSRATGDQIVTLFGDGFIDHPKAQAVIVRDNGVDTCTHILYVKNRTEMAVRLPMGVPEGAKLFVKHSSGETEVPLFRTIGGDGQLTSDASMLSAWVGRSAAKTPSPSMAGLDPSGAPAGEEAGVPLAYQNKFIELYHAVTTLDGAVAYASQRGPQPVSPPTAAGGAILCGGTMASPPDTTGLVKIDLATKKSTALGAPFACGANTTLAVSDDGSTLAAYHASGDAWPRKKDNVTAHQIHFFDTTTGQPKRIATLDLAPNATPEDPAVGQTTSILFLRSPDGEHWQGLYTASGNTGVRAFEVDVGQGTSSILETQTATSCTVMGGAPFVKETSFGTLVAYTGPGAGSSCALLLQFNGLTAPSVIALPTGVFALDASQTTVLSPSSPTGVDEFPLPFGPVRSQMVSNFPLDPTAPAAIVQTGMVSTRLIPATAGMPGGQVASPLLRSVDLSAYPGSFTVVDKLIGMAFARIHQSFPTETSISDMTETGQSPMPLQVSLLQGAPTWVLSQFRNTLGAGGSIGAADVSIANTRGTSALVTLSPPLALGEKVLATAFDEDDALYLGTTAGRLFKRPVGVATATLVATTTDAIAAILPWPKTGEDRGALLVTRTSEPAAVLQWWKPDNTIALQETLSTCSGPSCLTPFPVNAATYIPQWDGFVLKAEADDNFMTFVGFERGALSVKHYHLDQTFSGMSPTLTSVSTLGDRPGLFLTLQHADPLKDQAFFVSLPLAPPGDDSPLPAVAWKDSAVSPVNARMQAAYSIKDALTPAPQRFTGTTSYSVMNGRAVMVASGALALRPHDYGYERPQWSAREGIAALDTGNNTLKCSFGVTTTASGIRPYPFGCIDFRNTTTSDRIMMSPSGLRGYVFALATQSDFPISRFCLHAIGFDQGQLTLSNAGYCGGALDVSSPVLYPVMPSMDCNTDPAACRPEPWASALSTRGDELVFGAQDGRVISLR